MFVFLLRIIMHAQNIFFKYTPERRIFIIYYNQYTLISASNINLQRVPIPRPLKALLYPL